MKTHFVAPTLPNPEGPPLYTLEEASLLWDPFTGRCKVVRIGDDEYYHWPMQSLAPYANWRRCSHEERVARLLGQIVHMLVGGETTFAQLHPELCKIIEYRALPLPFSDLPKGSTASAGKRKSPAHDGRTTSP